MYSDVIFNVIQRSNSKVFNGLYVLLLAEGKWAIWYCRNLHEFEQKNVTFVYIKQVFINNLKLRILADFKRFTLTKFQNFWCSKNALCTANEGLVKFHL